MPIVDIDKISTEINRKRITRGGFLELGKLAIGVVATGAALSACGGGEVSPTLPQPLAGTRELPKPAPTLTPPEGAARLTGEVPGTYNEFSRQNRLQPHIYEASNDPQERTKRAVDYLRRFRDGLRNDPEVLSRLPSLSRFGIGEAHDYPTDIPTNWTIFNVMDRLLNEIDSNLIQFQQIDDPDVVFRAGEQAELVNGSWQRLRPTIFLADGLMTRDWPYQESTTTYYQGRTDAETASTLLHEFGHILQDERTIAIANQEPLSDASRQLIEGIHGDELRNRNREVIANGVIATLTPNQQELAPLIRQVQFEEVQSENLAFAFISALNIANGSDHFPGTRRRDLQFPFNIQEQQRLYPDLVIHDNYALFQERVVGTNNALDPLWILGLQGLK